MTDASTTTPAALTATTLTTINPATQLVSSSTTPLTAPSSSVAAVTSPMASTPSTVDNKQPTSGFNISSIAIPVATILGAGLVALGVGALWRRIRGTNKSPIKAAPEASQLAMIINPVYRQKNETQPSLNGDINRDSASAESDFLVAPHNDALEKSNPDHIVFLNEEGEQSAYETPVPVYAVAWPGKDEDYASIREPWPAEHYDTSNPKPTEKGAPLIYQEPDSVYGTLEPEYMIPVLQYQARWTDQEQSTADATSTKVIPTKEWNEGDYDLPTDAAESSTDFITIYMVDPTKNPALHSLGHFAQPKRRSDSQMDKDQKPAANDTFGFSV
jgi:hypothetical protein